MQTFSHLNPLAKYLWQSLAGSKARSLRFREHVNGELADWPQLSFARTARLKLPEDLFYRQVAVALGYYWDPLKPSSDEPGVVTILSMKPREGRANRLLILHEPTKLSAEILDNNKSLDRYLSRLISDVVTSSPDQFKFDIKNGNAVSEMYDASDIKRFMRSPKLMNEFFIEIYEILEEYSRQLLHKGGEPLTTCTTDSDKIFNTLFNLHTLFKQDFTSTSNDFAKKFTEHELAMELRDTDEGSSCLQILMPDYGLLLFSTGEREELPDKNPNN